MKLSWMSRVGPITLEERRGCMVRIHFKDTGGKDKTPLLLKAKQQIEEYLSGKRRKFDIPIAPKGTDYQMKVWNAALKVPYGETRTYGWISEMAGGSPRSAGNALGANPIPILIPCHRIVRSDGSLGGYSSGTHIKKVLLEIERLHLGESVLN